MKYEKTAPVAPGRVLVVEDDRLVALDIESMLVDFGFEHVATAHTGEEAIELARERMPELVLMDIFLEGKLDGVDAAEALLDELGIRVIYLTGYSDMPTVERAKQTLPRGYVLKPVRAQDLRCCLELSLHQVRTEQIQRSDAVFAQVAYGGSPLLHGLSSREREVMRLIALGLTSKDIAVKLGIAKPTVDTYRGRLAEKLGAKSRAELVNIAARAGLLQRD